MTRRASLSVAAYRRLPTEAAMRAAIADLVALRGGRLFFVRDSRAAPETADMPDLILLVPRPDGGVTAGLLELKSRRRAVTPGQREVAALLARADRLVAGVVRPEPRAGELSYDDVLRLLEEG